MTAEPVIVSVGRLVTYSVNTRNESAQIQRPLPRCQALMRGLEQQDQLRIGVGKADLVDLYDPPAIFDHDLDRDRSRGRAHRPHEPRFLMRRILIRTHDASDVGVKKLEISTRARPDGLHGGSVSPHVSSALTNHEGKVDEVDGITSQLPGYNG